MVIERVQGRGTQHAHLTHAATEHLAQAPRGADVLARADQRRTHRRAQALGEADIYRVERRSQGRQRKPCGNVGIPKPRTVEVQRKPQTPGAASQGFDFSLRKNPPSRAIVRVLDDDEPGTRSRIGVGRNRRFQLQGREQAAASCHVELHARERRARSRLVHHAVRAFAHDHRVSALAVQQQGELIAHGSRRHEQRRFFAEQLGDARLESLGRGIFAVHIVAHLGFGHGATHLGRGFG